MKNKTLKEFVEQLAVSLVNEGVDPEAVFKSHINNVHPEHRENISSEFKDAEKRGDKSGMRTAAAAAKRHAQVNIPGPQSLSSKTKEHLVNAHNAHKSDPEEFDGAYSHLNKAARSHYGTKGAPGGHKEFDSLPAKTQHSMVHALRNHKSDDSVQAQNPDTATSVGHLNDAVGYKG